MSHNIPPLNYKNKPSIRNAIVDHIMVNWRFVISALSSVGDRPDTLCLTVIAPGVIVIMYGRCSVWNSNTPFSDKNKHITDALIKNDWSLLAGILTDTCQDIKQEFEKNGK